MATLWTNEHAHRGHGAVVQVLVCKQHSVFDENSAGSQDEGGEQVDVDVVSGAAELPEKKQRQAERQITQREMQAAQYACCSCIIVKTHCCFIHGDVSVSTITS